jgi:glycosidase
MFHQEYIRKLLLICISIFITGCSIEKPKQFFHTVPTLSIKKGITKGFDLSVYKSDPDIDIYIEFHPDVILQFNSLNDSLFITPKDSIDGLILIPGFYGDDPFKLLVRVEPALNHTFTYIPQDLNIPVSIMGNFNDWSRTSHPLIDDNNDGIFEITMNLNPEKYEYKFVVENTEILDPENENVISNNMGGWNSVLDLSDFKESPAGQWIKKSHHGNYLTFTFLTSDDVLPMNTMTFWNNTPLHPDVVDPKDNGDVTVNINNLKTGLLRITGLDSQGRIIRENQTLIENGFPLNLKNNSDDWHFKTIYSLMIDRFFDGDTSNTKMIGGGTHPLADFYGGDIKGIIQKLEDGYFTELGISALWLSPFQAQPNRAFKEWNPPYRIYSGYHGYWPVASREVDKRFGSKKDLKLLIQSAHSQNINVLSDFVSNHVHENHPYYKNNKEWFGNVELPDGSMNIRRWDGETRLTTWFEPFLPSFDYSNPDAIDAVVSDAIWWMEEFNLDGFRQDAVKHVPHTFWRKLTYELKKNFPNKDFYQIGETFGSDELILSYINSNELDAQFNFDIYFSARNVFASDDGDMDFLNETVKNNLKKYQPINLMGTITSSHDQVRFISIADKQMTFSGNGTERAFSNPPEYIENLSSYQKLANFSAFNFSMPGIPIVYYGEELGLPGAGDPDNRRPMKFGKELTSTESMLRETVSNLAHFRKKYTALSVGDFYSVYADGPIWVYLKIYFGEIIMVALNQSDKRQSVSFENPIQVLSWRRLKNDIPISLEGNNTILHLQPYSFGYFLGE